MNGRVTSDHSVVIYKATLVCICIKRREVSQWKLKENQYKDEYVNFHEGKIVKWDESNDDKQIWEEVKRPVVNNNTREVCEFVRVGETAQRVSG